MRISDERVSSRPTSFWPRDVVADLLEVVVDEHEGTATSAWQNHQEQRLTAVVAQARASLIAADQPAALGTPAARVVVALGVEAAG